MRTATVREERPLALQRGKQPVVQAMSFAGKNTCSRVAELEKPVGPPIRRKMPNRRAVSTEAIGFRDGRTFVGIFTGRFGPPG